MVKPTKDLDQLTLSSHIEIIQTRKTLIRINVQLLLLVLSCCYFYRVESEENKTG